MAYVALKRLKWGDGFIEVGDLVPEDEPGRNYAILLFSHQIAGAESNDAPKPAKKPAAKQDAEGERVEVQKPETPVEKPKPKRKPAKKPAAS